MKITFSYKFIKRFLIAIFIIIFLLLLKGGLICDVYAATSSQSVNQQAQGNRLDFNLTGWGNWGEGVLTFNFGVYNTVSNAPFFNQSPYSVYVTNTAGDEYACTLSGVGYPGYTLDNPGGNLNFDYQSAAYSASCNVDMKTGGLASVHIVGFGGNSFSYFRVNGPVTFSNNDDIKNTINDVKNAINNEKQSIIDNQNQNSQKEIESQIACKSYSKESITDDNKYLNGNGTIGSNNDYGISGYINIENYLKITIKQPLNQYIAFYDKNKNFISTLRKNEIGEVTGIPENSSYMRFTIYKPTNIPVIEICRNGNQALSNGINDVNDTINDDDVTGADSTASDFFSDFQTTDHNGISGIITAPLRLIQALSGNSCSSLTIPLPFVEENIVLPCMSSIYSTYFPTFLTFYRIITTGIIAYWVVINIFAWVRRLERPDDDRIEVLNL